MRNRSVLGYPLGVAHVPDVPIGTERHRRGPARSGYGRRLVHLRGLGSRSL